MAALAAQDLQRDLFELIIVVNGPDDGTAEAMRAWSGGPPHRVIVTPTAGASRARNLGLVSAARDWVTFVDVDDRITPAFLRRLWDARNDGTVPTARMYDVDARGGHNANYTTGAVNRAGAGPTPVWQLATVASYNAAKLFPTSVARLVGYDEGLERGEDVVFMTSVLCHMRAQITVVESDAAYLRSTRAGSLSRTPLPVAEDVNRRMAVVARLHDLAAVLPPHVRSVVVAKARTQCRAIARLLEDQPQLAGQVQNDATKAGFPNWLAAATSGEWSGRLHP